VEKKFTKNPTEELFMNIPIGHVEKVMYKQVTPCEDSECYYDRPITVYEVIKDLEKLGYDFTFKGDEE
jgi:hypothetical protein